MSKANKISAGMVPVDEGSPAGNVYWLGVAGNKKPSY